MTNMRRGFFRLWVLVSALWMAATGLMWGTDLYNQRQRLKAYRAIESMFAELVVSLEAGIAAGGMTTSTGEWRDAGLLQLDLVDARVGAEKRKADIADLEARIRDQLAPAAATIVGPPLFLLLLGMAIAWVASGFRPRA
jgi:hypothetical protein